MKGPDGRCIQRMAGCPDILLDVNRASQEADVSIPTIRGWISCGKLPVTRADGRILIHPADLAATRQRHHVGNVVPAWRANPARAGARLRHLRQAAGQSQQELAARSGLTHELISRLELGRRTPFSRTVRSLARALGVTPTDFVSTTELAEETWSAAQAAAWLDVPTLRLYRWLKTGVLAGSKVSGQWRVPIAEVMALEASNQLRGRSRRLDPRFHE